MTRMGKHWIRMFALSAWVLTLGLAVGLSGAHAQEKVGEVSQAASESPASGTPTEAAAPGQPGAGQIKAVKAEMENGQVTIRDDRETGTHSGRLLRHGGAPTHLSVAAE